MSAYLITGSAGAGKSAVATELQRLGYAAYNTDEVPGLTGFHDRATNQPLHQAPPTPIDPSRYAWNWDIAALKRLLNSADHVFAAGITDNTIENLHLFNKIFLLHPSLDTLEHRLLTRDTNTFGKHPDELTRVLGNHLASQDFWRSQGAIIIDADQSVDAVAREILAQTPQETTA